MLLFFFNLILYEENIWHFYCLPYKNSVANSVGLLYSHNQLYIHICMQKHIQHNKDEWTQFFSKKYTSHFNERVRKGYEGHHCVRGELETEQNCNILTPTLMAITAILSRSPGLLNRGPGGPASAGTWFSFQHLLSNWLEIPVHRVILLFYAHSIQTVDSQGYPLTSSTGCTCYLHWCISSFDSLAGSEVNMQQVTLKLNISEL